MITEEFKKNLKEKYGIVFHNEKLLEKAFTHTSYENEHPGSGNYEKLEFLGDAVLELAVSDYLYRHFPKLNEGELTRLRSNIVRTEGFSEFAKEAGFAQAVNLGKGEEKSGARQRKTLLEDIFEAFNGALFLDQGMPAVQHFLHLTVYPLIAEGDFDDSRDYKTELQEQLQKNGPVKIKYDVIAEDETKPMFKVQLVVNGVAKTQGMGRNKKAAEQQAAMKELKNI
ncbi:ribonuclease III [Lactobacillus sp. PV037]|uniref:ribonuclease III n=1 Tax=Lactobacillus sp. PV037 TaxID=2594496 RepID=UPI00223FB0DA|nr:ribonuclease III [Lactobacillus sp. PV037]QNQ83865.1 ribonuclease III [Lactobacillus sp. PV037]